MNFQIFVEYTNGETFRTTFPDWATLNGYLNVRLDAEINAREVKNITITPVSK